MPGTVVPRFADGTGTALAALPGYICHVLVQAGGVGGVNYVPSTTSHRWGEYQRKQAAIERLRAAATAAAQFGVFRIPDKRSAELLAEGIRTEKALDPSLGLYAAYAYYDASRDEQIRSVMDFMGRDIQGRLFDVALLAGQFRRRETSSQPPIAPFCPMLTQGWNLLRSSGAELPKVLYDAQDDLVPALWTTFQPRRAELILDAMDNGILT
jgi:hypothetical protein